MLPEVYLGQFCGAFTFCGRDLSVNRYFIQNVQLTKNLVVYADLLNGFSKRAVFVISFWNIEKSLDTQMQ